VLSLIHISYTSRFPSRVCLISFNLLIILILICFIYIHTCIFYFQLYDFSCCVCILAQRLYDMIYGSTPTFLHRCWMNSRISLRLHLYTPLAGAVHNPKQTGGFETTSVLNWGELLHPTWSYYCPHWFYGK
jgi:hypothetical protein